MSLTVCAIYLPPNSEPALYVKHATCINELYKRLGPLDRIAVIGDYNLPYLNWTFDEDVGGFIPTNASTEQELTLVENIVSSGLLQMNYLLNKDARLLDLAFVSSANACEILEPPSPLMKLDRLHPPFILAVDSLPVVPESDIADAFYDFNQCDYDELNAEISQINWPEILALGTLDDAASRFYSELQAIFVRCVPLRRRTRRPENKQPWWNAELRNLRNRLRKARKRYFRTKSRENRETVRDLECQFNVLNTSCFQSYIHRLESNMKNDPKQFWTYLRNRSSSRGIPQHMNHGGKSSTTSSESANLFSSFFQSVLSNNSPPMSESYLRGLQAFDLHLSPVSYTQQDVFEKLQGIDCSKGSGSDELQPSFIKKCAVTLAQPASILFNRSLAESSFPTKWKEALITPIHKTGNVHDVKNYRGISILSCLPKVFESMLLDSIYPSIQHVITPDQHGFVRKRSTNTNLMSYVSLLIDKIEKRQQVDAVYVDFSKAFDRVPHLLAVEKLRRMGFPDWLTKWILSYLTNRRASVRIGATVSEPFAITSGVPQGSHLGPLLFVLFVNDLCGELQSLKVMYADDLKIFRVITSLLDCCALQMDIDRILDWCARNGMQVNIQKCNVITFTRKHSPTVFQYVMNNATVERVTRIKDLGIILNCKAQFPDQITSVTAKAFAILGLIKRNTKHFNNVYCLKTLYISLVRSILEYAVVVWAPQDAVHINRVERVQRSFIRFALRRLPWQDRNELPPYEHRCALVDLPTLRSRQITLQQLFVFDLLGNKIDCPALLEKLNFNAPSRALRRTDFFRLSAHRTQYGQNNPFDVCCNVFNNVYHLYDFNISKQTFKFRIRRSN